VTLLLALVLAQDKPPAYRPLRYEEDWSVLRDARGGDVFDPIKFIPLDEAEDVWLTLGGTIREQLEIYHHQDFGTGPEQDAYLLHRFYPYADLHFGDPVRAFLMLKNVLAFGTQNDPFPSQENTLDLHMAFVDLAFGSPELRLTIRPGRQELLYGAGRLIDDRAGPNSRWTYDVVRVLLESAGSFRIDALAGRPVLPEKDGFDDSGASDIAVWGVYANFAAGLDVYWLGIRREDWTFEEGTGDALRNSFGVRWFATAPSGPDWNVEAIVQVGDFDGGDLRAWAFNADVGWIYGTLVWTPRIGCRIDVHSGDRQAGDGELETFDPFFPRGILQGEAGSFGPPNLVAVTPELILLPGPDFYIGCRWSFYWRQSLDDGLYSLNLFPYAPAGTDEHRYIGRELSLTFGWNLDRHVGFWTVFSWTETGAFLEDSGYTEDQLFYSATVTIRF
jgi:hypothetical protein